MSLQQVTERKLLPVGNLFRFRANLFINSPVEWEAHEPGFFSVALFDHRKLLAPSSHCIIDLFLL